MAFPDDLSDVIAFKIHPAIGIARVSKNDDYFVYDSTPQAAYKSNGLMKRQAVQFRLFAYGENFVGLGELTPEISGRLGLTSVWKAKVANRKIAQLENVPLSGTQHVISAEAASDDANGGRLTGSLADFDEGAQIPLGQIMGNGLFVPPPAGVFRKRAGIPVPPYPEFTNEIADTTSDGSIRCVLSGQGSIPPVIPACIVVAPGDYSPDVNPPLNDPTESLIARLRQDIAPAPSAPGTLHNQTAQQLDEAALRPCTADFAPGFEVSFGNGEVPDLRAVFYRPGQDAHIAPNELRVVYRGSPAERGAVPGQLTSGLCSPWQTDFTACVGYWGEHIPTRAFLDENDQVGVNVYRKDYESVSPIPAQRLRSGDDFERHQDKIGVVRLRNSRPVETERNPGDDIVD